MFRLEKFSKNHSYNKLSNLIFSSIFYTLNKEECPGFELNHYWMCLDELLLRKSRIKIKISILTRYKSIYKSITILDFLINYSAKHIQ